MINYKYLIFDAQYLLTRNFKQKCNFYKSEPYLLPDGTDTGLKWKRPDFNAMDLSTLFLWSVAKYTREVASAEKIILVWDKYPYYKFDFLKDYKGDRHYASDDDLKGLDPENPDHIKKIISTQYDIDCLKLKQEAKYWMITNFEKLGMKSYIRKGYEADDLACIISKYLYDHDPNNKSAIVSTDSDWNYLVNPNVDKLNFPNARQKFKIVTHEKMVESNKDYLIRGIDLYRLKAIKDAAFGSHNNMIQTVKDGVTLSDILKDDSEDYLNIFEDKRRFDTQLRSFNFAEYPEYDKTIQSLYYLDKSGSIMDLENYVEFVMNSGFKVKSTYYSGFIKTLNPKLYSNV